MAYRADIEIGVRGADRLKELQERVTKLSRAIDDANVKTLIDRKAIQSVAEYSTVLGRASDNLRETAIRLTAAGKASGDYANAIGQYVTALGQANAVQATQNRLITDEIELRRKAKLTAAGIRETSGTTQLGPGPASPVGSLVGQKSPVAERISQTLQAKRDEIQLQAALLRLEEKSAARLNDKLELQYRLNRAALAQGKTDVETVSAQQAQRQQFLAGKSGTAIQGPLAGPGAMGFPVALALSKVEQAGLETAAKKQAILQRMAATKQALVGLASNLQRLELNAAVAIADAARNQNMLNAAKSRELQLVQQTRRETEATRSIAARQRLADAAAARQGGGGGGGGSRVGGAISSALIGGGFPLLFGQGPSAAAGGALGGVAGGLLGGGFGFALSIVGTALGDIITKAEAFDKSLAALNTGLSTTGSTSITTANDVSKLASSLNVTKEEAIELVNTFKQFKDGDTREALAGLFGPVGGAATFEAIAKAGVDEKNALAAIFSLRKEIGNDAALQLALQLKSVGASTTQASLLKIILDRSIEISVAQASQVNFTDRLLSIWEGIVAGVAQALSLATRFIAKMQEGSLIKLPFLDKIIAALGGFEARTPGDIAKERGEDVAAQLKAEQDRIRKALAEETRVAGTENALGQQIKQGAKPPADRTAQLMRENAALEQVLSADNEIRDALFQGKETRAANVEYAKALVGIELERVNALENANYASEKEQINRTAALKARGAALQNEDRLRELAAKRAEQELQMQEAVRSSVQTFKDMRTEQELQVQYSKTYYRLLAEGVLPAEAERLANFDKLIAGKLKENEIQTAITKSELAQTGLSGVKIKELEDRLKLLGLIKKAITGEGETGPGAAPIEATPVDKITEKIGKLKEEITALTNIGNIAITVAEGIGNAFATSFKGIIDGSMTAKEALGSFFKSVADMFLEMAAQIIAKQITMIILQTILKALGAVGGASGGAGMNSASAIGTNPNVAAYAPLANGGTFANGIATFANGGAFTNSVVSSPTMFKFADGGTTRTGLMGEAGPEAIMPLKRGPDGSLGVQANGLREAMGRPPGATSKAPVLNMKFETTSINGVEYVSRDQLESAMAVTRRQAANDGASRGMNMTLDKIQNSPSTRARVGIR